MIIFLFGRDSYRLKQNLENIVEEYKKKYSGLALSILDLNESGGLAQLEDAIKTVSFFDEKRLIVLKNTFHQAEKVAGLIKAWDLVNDKQRILVFDENADDMSLAKQNKELLAILTAQPNVIKYLEPLEGKHLENWVAREFKSAGVEVDPAAIKKLVSYVGQDSWRLSQEIIKLANYSGNSRPIMSEDVDLLVRPKEDFNIFQIVDAVAGKNKSRAAALIHDGLMAGEDPYYIFSMIAYQFRNLLRVKSLIKNAVPYAGIVKKTGLNPFVVKKTFDQCRGYDIDELRHLFTSLAQIDIEAKSGLMDMESGLYGFVFSL
ncbi:MAG: DNA polymerase III subunit delta [Candidatus Yanofskybacteria bacterium]|nr:DNA polymerase III subunit delta [Candidatus Yanofskybacteria bacterium]